MLQFVLLLALLDLLSKIYTAKDGECYYYNSTTKKKVVLHRGKDPEHNCVKH